MLVDNILSLVIFTLIYGFILSRLGKKFFDIPIWHYFIPYYNMVPLLKCARMNSLWAIAFFISGLLSIAVNIKMEEYGTMIFQYPTLDIYAYYIFMILTIALFVMITGKIAKRLDKNFWLHTIFSWTMVPILIFAFDKSTPIYDNSKAIE